MYIAFKWLAGLGLAMWIAMCIIDVCFFNSKDITRKGKQRFQWQYRNTTVKPEHETDVHLEHKYADTYQHFDAAALHYIMFIAGAIAVSVFNKKKEIISYTKDTIAKIDVWAVVFIISENFKRIIIRLWETIKRSSLILWKNMRLIIFILKNMRHGLKTNAKEKHKAVNVLLLKKFKEFFEERKKLGQLLLAAVQENKNIRMQHQLENMAKNRLVKHMEDTHKKIKENRSRYASFQHLYLVTNQENIFLKARIRKLTKDKENLEKDIMTIIKRVYHSNSNDLKAFCSRFIVKPSGNLLNADVSAEVGKFLAKSHLSANQSDDNKKMRNRSRPSTTAIIEPQDVSLVPLGLVPKAPRLKGLPGECIWTIKDKDGIIEKLYEYDFESDSDNGDTIRRIREYSVYYDKDCLLDFSSSKTVITEANPITLGNLYPANERFLTGSEAFQNFLQNNRNIVPSSRSPARSLLCV